jgi:hypothetical protein
LVEYFLRVGLGTGRASVVTIAAALAIYCSVGPPGTSTKKQNKNVGHYSEREIYRKVDLERSL